MPNKKNAMKSLRQAAGKRQINLRRTKKVKEAVKTLTKAVEAKDAATAKSTIKVVAKAADKAAAKKVIHKNKASRIRSRAQQKVNKLEAK